MMGINLVWTRQERNIEFFTLILVTGSLIIAIVRIALNEDI